MKEKLLRYNILRFFENAKYDRRADDFSVAERMMATFGMIWGVWLLNPFVNTFATSRSYTAMAGIAGEFWWGIAGLTLGAFQRATWAYDLRQRRRRSSFLMGMYWLFIAVSFAFSNPEGTGFPIYSLFALYCFYAYVKIPKGDAYGA